MTKNITSEYVLDSSREYSIYVCENRAIPKIADGLKDAQRKAAWLIKNKSDKIKTVSLAGELISSNLYLHGDASAAGTISMMAAPYVNNIPLFNGIGTFGTRVDPAGYAAPRYTYVKRGNSVQKLLFTDIDIVPMKENYDGSVMEPVHFLPLVPLILLNGISGIAVGWSTEILRRKFSDIVKATLDALDGKKIKRIPPHYNLYNINVDHVEDNTWEFSGKVSVVDSSTLHVTELPPDLSLIKFKERLNTLEDNGTINSYTDKSTKVIDITIKMARGAVKGWNEKQAIDFLKLRQKKTERIVVVDFNNKSIKQYNSAEELIEKFVEWRLGWYVTRYEHMLSKAMYSLNFWKGVKVCFDNKFPSRLTSKKNKADVLDDVRKTTKGIPLDDSQIDRIAGFASYRWAQDAYAEVIETIAELEANIAEYQLILADEALRREIYKTELLELQKEKFV